MKRIAVGLSLLALFFSCAGLDNRYLESLGSREKEELQTLDLELLDFTVTGDRGLVARVETHAMELLKGDLPNREYKAEILGILGLAQYYRGDGKAALKTAALIEQESASECRLYLIRAFMMKDEKKQLAYVTEHLSKAGRPALLQLFIAERSFNTGDYRRALAAYDEAFPLLHPRYRETYQKRRDLAFQFIDQPPVKIETRDLLAKSALSFNDFLTLILRDTSYLETVTADKKTPVSAILGHLQSRGYVRNENQDLQASITRGDAAYLLLRVLSILENNPSLPEKYTGAVRTGARSPVPDVATGDYFYTAVLVLVERELIDLPDGKNFHPHDTVSGGEYFEIIQRFKSRFGR